MEEVTVIWADKAKESARDIYGYLFEGSAIYAATWADEVERKIDLLIKFPEMGRIVPEFNISFIWEVFAGQYRIVYTFQNKIITVVSVRSMLQPLGGL